MKIFIEIVTSWERNKMTQFWQEKSIIHFEFTTASQKYSLKLSHRFSLQIFKYSKFSLKSHISSVVHTPHHYTIAIKAIKTSRIEISNLKNIALLFLNKLHSNSEEKIAPNVMTAPVSNYINVEIIETIPEQKISVNLNCIL